MNPYLLPALFKMKCPRCRKGNAFTDSNPYHLKHLGEMHALCPVCKLNFRPEPGFYFGGAIISYPIMVVFNGFITFLYYLVNHTLFNHIPVLLGIMLVASILIAPVVFRYSRIIFLYLMIRYKRP